MSFATQRAADAEFILSRENSEFGLAIQFWNSDLDPEEDPPTSEARGGHFSQPNDRREDKQGQASMRTVLVSVTKASVATIDDEGFMSVNGKIYSIEWVEDADLITWVIKGCRDQVSKLGDAARVLGG